jgi:hypothetical protein
VAPIPIHRAPMRARDRERPMGAGARFGVERGLVGIGDTPGDKGARMLHRFAGIEEGAFVWTRTGEGEYRLGRITGPWRYDDSKAARDVGIHHVRPAQWLGRAFGEDEVPAAVAATFARGGRNFQRTHSAEAERRTAELWDAHHRGA